MIWYVRSFFLFLFLILEMAGVMGVNDYSPRFFCFFLGLLSFSFSLGLGSFSVYWRAGPKSLLFSYLIFCFVGFDVV